MHRNSRNLLRVAVVSTLLSTSLALADEPARDAALVAEVLAQSTPDEDWPVELPRPEIVVTDEQLVRLKIRKEVAAALQADDYAALERWSAQYVAGERTPSGQWKLAFFHAGLESAFQRIAGDDDAGWDSLDQRLAAWAEQFPASSAARLLRAEARIARAWEIRGSGYASDVDPAAWEPFHEQLREAQRLLEAERAVAAADPQWYMLMARVALALGWPREEQDTLADTILENVPGYYDAVFAAALHYRPEWGGDWEQFDAFARKAVERTRATEGEGIYARMYWAQARPGMWLPKDARPDGTLLRRSIDDVLARHPDAWNRQHLAAMACAQGLYKGLDGLMQGLDGAVLSAWGLQLQYAICRNNATTMAND